MIGCFYMDRGVVGVLGGGLGGGYWGGMGEGGFVGSYRVIVWGGLCVGD